MAGRMEKDSVCLGRDALLEGGDMHVFVSYTRVKEALDGISVLVSRLSNELKLREPGSEVFLDTANLSGGSHYPVELEKRLQRSDVLLVLMSPAWLASQWCRREFLIFTRDMSDDRRLHRILPVLWVRTPQLEQTGDDRIARQLSLIQCVDWSSLRFEDWSAPPSKRAISTLAETALQLRADR
jgi:hypothetical protein